MNILQQLIFFINAFVLSILPTTQYTEGVTGQPESFLPHKAQTQTDQTISRLVYRGLFKYDIYGNLIPDLAESWTISSDGLVYTVTLKDGQYWTDGTEITSDDVIYTAFKVEDLQTVGTDKVDDRTVRFILPNEFSPFLSLLTVGIMQHQTEENFSPLFPPTSGDFRVLRVTKSGPITKEVILYNNGPEVEIRKIRFRYYTNEDELAIAAELGEIDGFLANKEYELENFENKRFPLQGVYFALFFNLNRENVQNVEVRQKLEKVLNKEQLTFDKGILVEGPISRSIFTNKQVEFNPHDPELNEDLEFDLTLNIPDIETHKEMAERIKTVWKQQLDVNLDIQAKDPETFVEEVVIPRDYELLLFGQEISRDPGRYVNWHSTQKEHPGLNLSNFEHVRSDRALEEARIEIDPDARIIHYNEFQKVIVEQVPAIFLYHPYRNFYVSKFITGIGSKYTFTVEDRFLDFANWEIVKTN